MQEPQTPEKTTTPKSSARLWRGGCDCVLILQSPVSEAKPAGFLNYVTRFFDGRGRVIKVLPDLRGKTFRFSPGEGDNIELLHVYRRYGPIQQGLINKALVSRRLLRPALYLDNWRFFEFYIKRFAAVKIMALKETVYETEQRQFHKMMLCSDLVLYGDKALAEALAYDAGYKGQLMPVPYMERHYDEAKYPAYMTYPSPAESGPEAVQETLAAFEGHLERIAAEPPKKSALDILMLCDRFSTHTNTIREYVEAFGEMSGNRYAFADAREKFTYDGGAHGFVYDFGAYDAVVIHFSVRQCFPQYTSPRYLEALKQYGGYKVLMVQDDYDLTEVTRKRIEEMGVHEVLTPVPEANIPKVYPPERFTGVRFQTVLTGYVTAEMAARREFVPLGERKNVFCYRGRPLHYQYGISGHEKLAIGVDMRRICEERGVPCDIEWTEEKRIYGAAWDDFISDARAMLASESGASIFDFDGSLKKKIDDGLAANPDMTFGEAFEKYLKDIDGQIIVNVVSPKMFEAIAHRTALVMYTGEYSGILKPDVLLEKVMDDAYLTALTERAYEDIIASGRYDYQSYVDLVDGAIRSAGAYSPPGIIFQLGKNETWRERSFTRFVLKNKLYNFLHLHPALYAALRRIKRSMLNSY